MTNPMRWMLAGLLGLASLVDLPRVSANDELADTKARMVVEAQRIEKEFAASRLAAYKLVRNDSPNLVDATQKLQDLLTLIRADSSLDEKRRQVLIVTLKADLDRVGDIAVEKKRFSGAARSTEINRAVRDSIDRDDKERRAAPGRRISDDLNSIYETRRRAVDEDKRSRIVKADRLNALARDVDKSATPESGDVRFDAAKWAEISKRRSTAQKMTDKERAILRVLDATLNANYENNTFEEIMEHLRTATKVDIIVDEQALKESGAGYESKLTVKLKTSTRTVLKKVLADLNLTYVVKDEAILITSRERANQLTTTRTYYLGDLAAVTDSRLPPFISQALALEKVTNLISLITSTVDPQSWKVNNPDAVGVIVFDARTLSLTVKQAAEIHYKLGGR